MNQASFMLSSLLDGIADIPAGSNVEITSMTLDSREVTKGCLFVALKGTQQHGLAYAKTAEKLGAVAIISEVGVDSPLVSLAIPKFEIANLREYLGLIADRFYQSPSQFLKMVGITGTDGKTSVSHFMAQALSVDSNQCAVIGTLGIGTLKKLKKATHTTPDVINVHRSLSEIKQQGVSTIAMEVSSHALDQGRVANVQFDVAVLTNLTRDHLDYHGTLEAYAEAKEKLFYWPSLKAVVLNLDDGFGRKILTKVNGLVNLVIGYGVGNVDDYPQGSLVAENAKFSVNGMSAQVCYGDEKGELNVSVLGRFNLSNLLATLGAMLGLGISLDDALGQLNKVQTVSGRMEKVSSSGENVLAVVDYAHTPNALETVLKALREHTEQNLICVFGCGGDRDTGKRPLMAAIAEQYADSVIVTDDNPRSENPEKIMKDIVTGLKQPEKVMIEHDRASAIRQALQQAKTGDAVLIAGKGHENVQILATGTVPFSDREQANKVLEGLAA